MGPWICSVCCKIETTQWQPQSHMRSMSPNSVHLKHKYQRKTRKHQKEEKPTWPTPATIEPRISVNYKRDRFFFSPSLITTVKKHFTNWLVQEISLLGTCSCETLFGRKSQPLYTLLTLSPPFSSRTMLFLSPEQFNKYFALASTPLIIRK